MEIKSNKKIVYYYYDKESNRRPLDLIFGDGYELMIQKEFINDSLERDQKLKGNFYALVDGFEFKLD